MTSTHLGRPSNGEYVPYYDTYIRLVPDGDLLALLDRQIDETVSFLSTLSRATRCTMPEISRDTARWAMGLAFSW